jgi:hypothetical protein
MSLNEPRAGLRPPGVRLFQKTNDVAKISLSVPVGSEMEVDDDVARQLLLSGAFAPIDGASGGAVVEAPAGAVAASTPAGVAPVEEAGGGAARRRSGRRSG